MNDTDAAQHNDALRHRLGIAAECELDRLRERGKRHVTRHDKQVRALKLLREIATSVPQPRRRAFDEALALLAETVGE